MISNTLIDPAPGYLETESDNDDISVPRFDCSQSYDADSDFDDTRDIQWDRDLHTQQFDQFLIDKIKETVSHEGTFRDSFGTTSKQTNTLAVQYFEDPTKSCKQEVDARYFYDSLNSGNNDLIKSWVSNATDSEQIKHKTLTQGKYDNAFKIDMTKSIKSQRYDQGSVQSGLKNDLQSQESNNENIDFTDNKQNDEIFSKEDNQQYIFVTANDANSQGQVEITQDVTPDFGSDPNNSNSSLQYSKTSVDKHEDFWAEYAQLSAYINNNEMMKQSLARRNSESQFDRNILLKQIEDLKSSNVEYSNKIEQLTDENERLRVFYEAKIDQTYTELQNLDKQSKDYQLKINAYEENFDKLNELNRIKDDLVKAKNKNIQELTSKISQVKVERELASKELLKEVKQNEELQSKYAEAKDKHQFHIDSYDKHNKAHEEKVMELVKKINELHNVINEKSEIIENLKLNNTEEEKIQKESIKNYTDQNCQTDEFENLVTKEVQTVRKPYRSNQKPTKKKHSKKKELLAIRKELEFNNKSLWVVKDKLNHLQEINNAKTDRYQHDINSMENKVRKLVAENYVLNDKLKHYKHVSEQCKSKHKEYKKNVPLRVKPSRVVMKYVSNKSYENIPHSEPNLHHKNSAIEYRLQNQVEKLSRDQKQEVYDELHVQSRAQNYDRFIVKHKNSYVEAFDKHHVCDKYIKRSIPFDYTFGANRYAHHGSKKGHSIILERPPQLERGYVEIRNHHKYV